MNKKRISVVVTARPSYSRIRSFLEANKLSPGDIDLGVVCAASALSEPHGNVSNIIEDDGYRVDMKLHCLIAGNEPISMTQTVASYISQLSSYFSSYKPNAVVTIADRYETIGTAIAASYLNIPLIHVQGGELTGSIDDKVRFSVTSLSDYHFVSNKYAYDRVLKVNRNSENIFVVGCPSIDLCPRAVKISASSVSDALNASGVGDKINLDLPFLVFLYHPDTSLYHDSGERVSFILNKLSKLPLQLIVLWPNSDAGGVEISHRIRQFRETSNFKLPVRYLKNLRGELFLKLLMLSEMLVGNSSVGIRECSALGVKVVNIGTRQRQRDRANNVLDVPDFDHELGEKIIQFLKTDRPNPCNLYGDGDAGIRMNEIIKRLPLR